MPTAVTACRFLLIAALLTLAACAAQPHARTETASSRRAFTLMHNGSWAGDAICYGPHRDGQGPGGAQPTYEQVAEDARIMAKHWCYVRMYGVGEATEHFLKAVKTEQLPLQLLMGIWIAPEEETGPDGTKRTNDTNVRENRQQIEGGIRLAREYAPYVCAIGVGNETQVQWSTYRSSLERLRSAIREVRSNTTQPVTTCDSYEFWLTPESKTLTPDIDFLAVHLYAMWNKQPLPEALAWTREHLAKVREAHPTIPIVITEIGWATDRGLNGYQAEGIVGPWGEGPQETFHRAWRDVATRERIGHFWFQAFDEKWKGGTEPNEVEKHWGVYFSDRTPKRAVRHDTPRQ